MSSLRCPACGVVNASGARFCRGCGEVLAPPAGGCPVCGQVNSPGARYCRSCGATLARVAVERPPLAMAIVGAETRRRSSGFAALPGGPVLWVSVLVLAAVVASLILWLLVFKPSPAPGGLTEYATRQTAVKTSDDPSTGVVIGQIQRGASVSGAWVLGPDGKSRWFKIRWDSSPGYVSGADLSDRPRPPLADVQPAAKQALSGGPVYAEPDASANSIDTVAPGETLQTTGVTADGWTEIADKLGPIGYVKSEVFQAPTPPPPVGALPAGQMAADAAANAADAAAKAADASAKAAAATASTQGVITVACAYAPEQSVNAPPSLPGMALTLDEGRACVNGRTAYRRDGEGGLSRVMLVGSERRASLLYFTPDRRTFSRQDLFLPAAAYGALRPAGPALAAIPCPTPGDPSGAARSAAALAQVTPALDPRNPPPGSSWRRLVWRCAPVQ